MSVIIGIDPGKSGGLSAIYDNGRDYRATKMPPTELDIRDCISDLVNCHTEDCRIYIEKVGIAIPGSKGTQGMIKLNRNFGILLGCLACFEMRYEEVPPGVWQGVFGLRRKNKKETDTAKKNRHKRKAQQLFPKLKITHAISDALLIAEYGRRMELTEVRS